MTETVRWADEMLPGVKEKIEQAAPVLSERARQMLPMDAAPVHDVGGEDIPGVPRYAGLVRVAYALNEGKRSATWPRSASQGRCWRQRPARTFASIARRSKGCAWKSAGTNGRARMRSKWSSPRPET